MPFSRLCLLPGFLALALAWPGHVRAQEETPDTEKSEKPLGEFAGVGVVPKLSISRKTVPNFLVDETLAAVHASKGSESETATLEGVFTIGANSSRYAVFWDPLTCRLLGVLDLEPDPVEAPTDEADGSETASAETEIDKGERAEGSEKDVPLDSEPESPPSPFFLLAGGRPPLGGTAGGSGEASFFGVRLIDGKPEFLYEQGSLLIEERLWLENGGETLQQQFTLRDMNSSLVLEIPEAWRQRVTSDRGEWDEGRLTVDKEEAGEVRLTYRLGNEVPTPEGEKSE